jgi:hypothetical protein
VAIFFYRKEKMAMRVITIENGINNDYPFFLVEVDRLIGGIKIRSVDRSLSAIEQQYLQLQLLLDNPLLVCNCNMGDVLSLVAKSASNFF